MNSRRYFHEALFALSEVRRGVVGRLDGCGRLQSPLRKQVSWIAAGLLLACFSGCDRAQTADIGNSKEMIAALTEKVPKGTPLAAAKTFMQSEKFEVEDLKKAKWKGKSDVTYLKCTRKDGSPPIFRQWEVALINDGKVVTSIEARTALLYP